MAGCRIDVISFPADELKRLESKIRLGWKTEACWLMAVRIIKKEGWKEPEEMKFHLPSPLRSTDVLFGNYGRRRS